MVTASLARSANPKPAQQAHEQSRETTRPQGAQDVLAVAADRCAVRAAAIDRAMARVTRVAEYKGFVFGSYAAEGPTLEEHFGRGGRDAIELPLSISIPVDHGASESTRRTRGAGTIPSGKLVPVTLSAADRAHHLAVPHRS